MGLQGLFASALMALLLPLGVVADPALVLVDPSRGYATVYVSVPTDLPADAREALEIYAMEHEGAYLQHWNTFVRDLRTRLAAGIRRNDYPEVDTVESLVLLLRHFEMRPLAVTWNGGLALSPDEYTFAELTYEAFRRNSSFVARPSTKGSDPVHPWNHTGPLLYQRPSTGLRC